MYVSVNEDKNLSHIGIATCDLSVFKKYKSTCSYVLRAPVTEDVRNRKVSFSFLTPITVDSWRNLLIQVNPRRALRLRRTDAVKESSVPA